MEKIYTHEESNYKKKSGLSVISFTVIACVAIFALVIVGFNQISFAIPDVGTNLGNTFTSYWDGSNFAIGSTSSFRVGKFETDSGEVVFCLERDIDYKSGLLYSKGDVINDAGLLYLMANLYPNISFKDDSGNDLPEIAQIWLSQSAIWIYVAESHQYALANPTLTLPKYPNNTTVTTEMVNKIKSEVSLYKEADSYLAEVTTTDVSNGITSLYQKYGINDILTTAANLRGHAANSFEVKRNSEGISVSQDGKHYITDYFYVVAKAYSDKIGTFNGYEVSLVNAPEGTTIIDMDGNEIRDLSNLSSDTRFRLKIPVDNVNNDNKNLSLSFTGSFDTYTANKYIFTDSQTVTNVKKINNNLIVPYTIEANYSPRVPDTALQSSGTYFFVGIILLLSGLGVFYTSAKVKKD